MNQLLDAVALGQAVTYVPISVAYRHSCAELVFVPVSDLSPSEVVAAWPDTSRSRAVASFVHTAGRIDLTEAEFDDHVIDLHVYSGWGSITIIVPSSIAMQITHHRGGVDSRLEPPVPGFPLVRLDVTANIGRVHLRHPGAQHRTRRWPRFMSCLS